MKRKLSLAVILLLSTFYAQAQFALVGSATGPGIYNLTPLPGVNQAGAIWCDGTNPSLPQFLDFTKCFTLNFMARETKQLTGADGFCAVFGSNITLTSINNNGGHLGYYDNIVCPGGGTINPDFKQSLAVEFDIFDNSFLPCTFDPSTPYFDHSVVARDGDFTPLPGSGPVPVLPFSATLKDGAWHRYEIAWDCGNNRLNVRVDGNLISSTSLTGSNSPASIFGAGVTSVQWGFTGGTGFFNSDQEITQVWLNFKGPNVCVDATCCTPDYQFNFTSSSSCPTTVWYVPVDYAGTPLCPPTSITFSGLGVMPYSALASYCPMAYGLCIVGYSDCNCSWGFTGAPNCNPALPSGCCAWVNMGHKNDPTSVAATENLDKLSISPNPNNGSFILSGKLSNYDVSNLKMEVYDITGKILYSSNAPVKKGVINETIKLDENIPNGVYFLKASTAGISHQLQLTLIR